MKAFELLNERKKWTQNAFSRDSRGAHVSGVSHNAVCWCATEAINVCYDIPTERSRQKIKLNNYLEANTEYYSIMTWNDSPVITWQDVHDTLKQLDI